jgi:hypothetical protein
LATGKEELVKDLAVLEAMAAKMPEYLSSDELFWRKIDSDPVQPTIGGYLMRQNRLQALSDPLLDEGQRRQLAAAVTRFEQAVSEQPGRLEAKGQQELKSRLRQWEIALKELLEDEAPALAYYRADVETRIIIATLLMALQQRSVRIEPAITDKLAKLDQTLRQRWQPGEFVWPDGWQPAYPRSDYWWLYGRLN